MDNYQVWNKQSERGDNKSKPMPMSEPARHACVWNYFWLAVSARYMWWASRAKKTMRETLASDEGLDAINRMLRDVER